MVGSHSRLCLGPRLHRSIDLDRDCPSTYMSILRFAARHSPTFGSRSAANTPGMKSSSFSPGFTLVTTAALIALLSLLVFQSLL